jgi:hypothetical protein
MRNNRKIDKLRKGQVSQEKKNMEGREKRERRGMWGGEGGGRRGKGQNINMGGSAAGCLTSC